MCARNVFAREHLVALSLDGPTGMCWLLQCCSKALSHVEPARCPGWLSAPYPMIKEESTARQHVSGQWWHTWSTGMRQEAEGQVCSATRAVLCLLKCFACSACLLL